jgi:hypothetical protein
MMPLKDREGRSLATNIAYQPGWAYGHEVELWRSGALASFLMNPRYAVRALPLRCDKRMSIDRQPQENINLHDWQVASGGHVAYAIMNIIIVLGISRVSLFHSVSISYKFLCLRPALPLPVIRLVDLGLCNVDLRRDSDTSQATERLVVQSCHTLRARLARAWRAPA